jgi:archaellum component FlaC
MAGKQVNIDIKTKADTSGVDAAAKSINSIAYTTGQTADKANVAAFAFYDLDAAIQKNSTSSVKLKKDQQAIDLELVKAKKLAKELADEQQRIADTAKKAFSSDEIKKMGESYSTTSSKFVKGSGNMAFAIGNVGNQLQDIAVQAQSGTSAITILSQQGPQLLSGFGPQGAIAGAVLALGGLILSTMIKSTEAAKKAAEEAWNAADEFAQKTQDAFKKAGGKEADDFIEKFDRIKQLTIDSAQAEIDLAGYQRERAKSQGDLIKSQEDLAIASIKYLDATGQIIDAEQRIAEIQGASREAQKQVAEADIMAAVKPSEIRYKTILKQIEDARNEEQRIQESINQLQAQQAQVNRQANIFRQSDKGMVAAGVQKEGYVSTRTSQLENQLAGIEAAISALQKQSDQAPQKIQSLIDQSFAVAQEFDLAQKSANAQIQELNQRFNVQESTQELNRGIAVLTEGVQTLKEDVAKIEPINAAQQQAKDTITAALSDGKLTADEMLKVGAALQQLLGSLKSGQEGNIQVIQEMQRVQAQLIQSNNQLVAEAQRQAGLIRTIQPTR